MIAFQNSCVVNVLSMHFLLLNFKVFLRIVFVCSCIIETFICARKELGSRRKKVVYFVENSASFSGHVRRFLFRGNISNKVVFRLRRKLDML